MNVQCSLSFNTTTEVPLSKAPNPQLLPGRRSMNGCPLLRVCAHGVCVFTAMCVGNSTDMTILGDVIKPQTLSNEGLRNKPAFKGVNIWRGVNTLLPDKPIRFQMVFKCDLRGQSI